MKKAGTESKEKKKKKFMLRVQSMSFAPQMVISDKDDKKKRYVPYSLIWLQYSYRLGKLH